MASTRDTIPGLERRSTKDLVEGVPPPELADQLIAPGKFAGDPARGLRALRRCLADHTSYRRACLNLIASENAPSPLVAGLQSNELSHRYGDYVGADPTARKYSGTRHIARLEQLVAAHVKQLFGAEHVDLRPLSGHVAGIAVLMALCQPGDTVVELDAAAGGHRLAEKLSEASLVNLEVAALPFDAKRFNVDIDRSRELVRRLRPRVVILGSSGFLFPHPVTALREIVDEVPGTYLLYDASHVLGLIAGGRFQRPLREGAHIVTTSTHKTFAGPQGGMVLTNDRELAERVGTATYPALVTNHHLHRIPALGAACLEWLKYGPAHAAAVVANAQAFARHIASEGIEVVSNGLRFTDSHTVLLALRNHGEGTEITKRLESARIITDASVLPDHWGREGLRLGFQEVTRRGMTPEETRPVAKLVANVISGRRSPEDSRDEVRGMAERLDECSFVLE